MPFKDVLLTLTTYPYPTPVDVIDQAINFTIALEARLSAIACAVEVRAPGNVLANSLLGLSAMAAAETQRSAEQAQALLVAFESSAKKRGVFQGRILENCLVSEVPSLLTEYARLKDLTIVPVPEGEGFDQWYAESIIFGSGRPALVMPQTQKNLGDFSLDTVVVAWDHSRPAARALADALPILKKAKKTFVLTVTNEKSLESGRPDAELIEHLQFHGVDVVQDTVDAENRSIGEVLRSSVVSRQADLLVMGAFGHSRIRDFVLGGATKSMIAQPPVPIFLSH